MHRLDIGILGVPIDLGGNHRGVDMGPNALRVAGINEGLRQLGHDVRDFGDIAVPNCEQLDVDDPSARYLAPIAAACSDLARSVQTQMGEGRRPIVIGGDHSLAVGSVTGAALHHEARGEKIGLIWVDAHTDMNAPDTSPSGNVHGMPVAALLGKGPSGLTDIGRAGPKVDPKHVAMIGIRSVDEHEAAFVRESGITVFTMREVDELGVREVMRRALAIANAGTAGYHLSYDIDVIDPPVAPGVGTPVPGGLTYREAHLVAELAHDSGKMLSMDVVEVNPTQDLRNKTAEVAVEIVLSAHGKRIL